MSFEEYDFSQDTQNQKSMPRDNIEDGYYQIGYEEKKFYLFESQHEIDDSEFYQINNALIIRKIQPSFLNGTIKEDGNGNAYFYAKFIEDQDMEKINKLGEKGVKEADRLVFSIDFLTQQYINLKDTKKVLWISASPTISNDNTFFRITKTDVQRYPISTKKEDQTDDISDNNALVQIEAVNAKSYNRKLQNYLEYFTSEQNPLDINDLAISLERRTLLGIDGIRASGLRQENNNNLERFPLDVRLNGQFYPLKVSVNEIKDNMLYHFDWFDNNVVLKFIMTGWDPKIAKDNTSVNFKNGIKLKDFKVILDPNTNLQFTIDSTDIKLISDMIMLTYGFLTNFSFADKYTAQEVKDLKLPSDQIGKVKLDYICGYGDYKIAEIQNEEPAKYIQNVFDSYILNNPAVEYSKQRFPVLKSLIIALGNYIASENFSFGRTRNRFNEFYLPWFLCLKDGEKIKILPKQDDIEGFTGKATRNILDPNIKFIAKSMYFNNIFTKQTNCFSELIAFDLPYYVIFPDKKVLNADRSVSLPLLDAELAEKDKYSKIGDMNISTNEDLNYVFLTSVPWMYSFYFLTKRKYKNDFVLDDIDFSNYGFDNPSPFGQDFFIHNGYANFDDFINKNFQGRKCDITNAGNCDYEIVKAPIKQADKISTPTKNEQGYSVSYNLDYTSIFVRNIKIISITTHINNTPVVGKPSSSKRLTWEITYRTKNDVIRKLGYNINQAKITDSTFDWNEDSNNKIPFGQILNKVTTFDATWSDEEILTSAYKKYWNTENFPNYPYVRATLKNDLSNSIYSGSVTLELKQELYGTGQIKLFAKQPSLIDSAEEPLFDFNDWNNFVKQYSEWTNTKEYDLVKYPFTLLNKENIIEVDYLNVKQIFGKKMILHSKGIDYNIDLTNQLDADTSFEIMVV